MDGIIFGFFALSAILFFGMIHYFMATQKTGVYPPKNILKRRAGVLGTGGIISLLLGILLWLAVK
ncbi:hypothetical protein D3H55_08170 [Bacillus salacetis]|uniref:Uncharacterized protein n=1 Tax=Bacillus salacetis TaxID=2315464 RepID=A0A3A1R449_9BACI|nr:hypothetical protein [Bacillus salacetis]RIW35360.1 hypothetical protein D3H55_08170 [Bacillus salacetis]